MRFSAPAAQLLWRVSDSFTLPVERMLADGSYLSQLNGARGKRTTVRVIEYTVVTATLDTDGVSEETSDTAPSSRAPGASSTSSWPTALLLP
ncbi:hypothetical protein ACWGQ5_00245 [Streptomyces sp. NPDC055722]